MTVRKHTDLTSNPGDPPAPLGVEFLLSPHLPLLKMLFPLPFHLLLLLVGHPHDKDLRPEKTTILTAAREDNHINYCKRRQP